MGGLASPTSSESQAVTQPILQAVSITKHFPVHRYKAEKRLGVRRVVHAVDDVSLNLYPGRVTALVGESGSGKSTLARLLAGLYRQTSGQVLFRGSTVNAKRGKAFRRHVGEVQLILQDPYGSFNPMLKISRDIRRALRVHEPQLKGADLNDRMEQLLSEVKLEPAAQFLQKFPHELSGGQLQRTSIARALAARPSVILADEPVSNLDVSIRLGVLNLLAELTAEQRVALLYVTHDVASARYFADDIAVMYAGQLIESGPSEIVTSAPAHPYTQLLVSSAPDPARPLGEERVSDKGQPPSLVLPPTGCRFHPRCPFAKDECRREAPPPISLAATHWTRCFIYTNEKTNGRKEEGH
jgi:peptide/nickel transport system ATP-binding protein